MTEKRGPARVCSICFYDLRPTEYAPDTYNYGTCVKCDDTGFVFRVSWIEIDAYNAIANGEEILNAHFQTP